MSDDLNTTLQNFINSKIKTLQKKGLIISTNQDLFSGSHTPDLSDLSPETSDAVIALSVAASPPACVHHTSHTMLNPSSSYTFANNPGASACSNPALVDASRSSFLPCKFPISNAICPFYSADYKIIKKVVSINNSSSYYYLSKFRLLTGSYSYKIYDNTLKVYLELSYDNISDSENVLDSEAISIFNSFIDQAMLKVDNVDLYSSEVISESNKVSYLSTLIS